jgi:FlaA1/EpsC-like NDP-sugar epimerase
MSANFRRIALQKAARLLDLAVVSLTLVAAVAISSSYSTWPTLAEFLVLRIKVVNILIFGGYLVVCSAILSSCGLYKSHRLSQWTRQAREIFLATSLITAVLYLLPRQMLFATKEFLFLFWLFNFMVLSLARVVGYQLFYYVRSRGKNLRNLVIVGESADAVALGNRIEQETSLGYRVLRIINAKEINEHERITDTRPT